MDQTEIDTRKDYLRQILAATLIEVSRYTPPDNWRTMSMDDYFSQYFVFDLSVPRLYGKTRVLAEAENSLDHLGDGRVYFVGKNEFTQNFTGRRRPFGDLVEILIFEEFFDSRHISFIVSNWLALGYDTLPKVIVLRTKSFVEDYKHG
jgi:hypothetical protein